MKTALILLLSTAALLAQSAGKPVLSGKLTIDFIDVEGGQATLFITPTGESLLIDTGWSGNDSRDATRIADAAHKAGLTRIDFVLITHYHVDHVGGVSQLLAKIPVGTFFDHGPNRELDDPSVVQNYSEFVNTLATNPVKEIVIPKPGGALPIPDLDVTVISSDGKLLATPLAGAGAPNPFCKESGPQPRDTTENPRSLGVEIKFGRLKILDLGDLTTDKELELMCPNAKLGPVDILIVSHHGWEQSSSPALVKAVHARVAIMDNGETKGGSTSVFKTLAASPGLEQLWQLHYSVEAGKALNQPDAFIANLPGPDSGNSLQLTASPDGNFTILNTRTGATQRYAAQR